MKNKNVIKKGACFTCLIKTNNMSKYCDLKSRLKCNFCSSSHYDIMCNKKQEKPVNVTSAPNSEVSLSNSGTNQTVYLQTLSAVVRGQGQEKLICILFDSGSQYSHISERVIAQLGLVPHRTETIIHSLFGGSQMNPKRHGVYSIELRDLKGTFSSQGLGKKDMWVCSQVNG